jgi:hypothetical protein
MSAKTGDTLFPKALYNTLFAAGAGAVVNTEICQKIPH